MAGRGIDHDALAIVGYLRKGYVASTASGGRTWDIPSFAELQPVALPAARIRHDVVSGVAFDGITFVLHIDYWRGSIPGNRRILNRVFVAIGNVRRIVQHAVKRGVGGRRGHCRGGGSHRRCRRRSWRCSHRGGYIGCKNGNGNQHGAQAGQRAHRIRAAG